MNEPYLPPLTGKKSGNYLTLARASSLQNPAATADYKLIYRFGAADGTGN